MISTTPEPKEGIELKPAGFPDPIPTIRILQVEDNEDERRILALLLHHKIAERITLARVEIIGAATMTHGLEIAPMANCTILDLSLPDSTIEETIAAVRNNRFRPPVIIITGTDDPAIIADCLAAGAEHVFVKGQIHGLCNAVLDCIAKDILRLNGVLNDKADATT